MKKQLTLSRQGATVDVVADIGDVQHNIDTDDEDEPCPLFNAEITAVEELSTYPGCVKCHSRVEPLTPPTGRCSSLDCGAIVQMARCMPQVSAKLLVEHSQEGTKYKKALFAHGTTLANLAGLPTPQDIKAIDLLSLPKFKCITYSDDTITTFDHYQDTEV